MKKIMQRHFPTMHKNLENESLVNEYRVAAGLTHCEIARLAGVPQNTFSALASGALSPIMEDGSGRLRPSAQRLCDFFSVDPEELFPRYFCALDRARTQEMEPYQTWPERAVENCGDSMESRLLARKMIKLCLQKAKKRERDIFLQYLYKDRTYREIGEDYKITRDRVEQIVNKTFRRILQVAILMGLPVSCNNMHPTIGKKLGEVA